MIFRDKNQSFPTTNYRDFRIIIDDFALSFSVLRMSTLVLRLRPADTYLQIFRAMEDPEAKRLIFLFPRNGGQYSDLKFLKLLKTKADEEGKELLCITSRLLIHQILKTQSIPYDTRLKGADAELPVQTLPDYLGVQLAVPHSALASSARPARDTPPAEGEHPANIDPAEAEAPSLATALFSSQPITDAPPPKSIRGLVFFGLLGLISTLVLIILFIVPQATITVKPTLSAAPITQNFIVAFPESRVPSSEDLLPQIPGYYVQSQISGSEIYASTRSEYDIFNAVGKVTLYNETTRPKSFVPSRLQADTGEVFRFAETVTVPGATTEAPGAIVVDVIADAYDADGKVIGKRGNLEPDTKLFFPALSEDMRTLYYARADQGPFVQGDQLEKRFIQQADLDKAPESFLETFGIRGLEGLKANIRERATTSDLDLMFLDDPRLIKKELVEVNIPEELLNTETNGFRVEGTVKVFGVLFDKAEIVRVMADKLRESTPEKNKLLALDADAIDYRVLESAAFDSDKWLKLSISMVGAQTLDLDSQTESAHRWRQQLKQELVGLTPEEARSRLVNLDEIEDVTEINIQPFWARTLPNIIDQLEITVEYDDMDQYDFPQESPPLETTPLSSPPVGEE